MQRSRILSLAIVVLLLTTIVGIRLIQLQAMEWRQHALRASSMHRSVRYIPGPRGEIQDAYGVSLASDIPVIRATFLLSELEPVRWVARRLARTIGTSDTGFPWDEEALWSSLQQARQSFRPKIIQGVPLEEHPWLKNIDLRRGNKLARAIKRRPEDFPGIRVEPADGHCTVYIDPGQLLAGEVAIRRLERLLDLPVDELWGRIESIYARVQDHEIDIQEREWIFRRQRHLLLDEVPDQLVVELSTHPENWPGIHLEEVHERVHSRDPHLGQLLGYAGLPTDREISRWKQRQEPIVDRLALRDLRTFEVLRPFSHHSADRVGRSGLEKLLEDQLRGTPGAEVRILDHRRRLVGSPLQVAPAERGQDVVLNIDSEFSEQCGLYLQEAGIGKGAVAVIDVASGKTIGWTSLPGQGMEVYRDRNLYAERSASNEGWFHDRVCSWPIDPGSTFKTVVALVALQNGLVTGSEKILCDGILDAAEPNRNRCANHPRGLELDLPLALSRSCNVYFYKLGQRLGIDGIVDGARRFGLWSPTSCGLSFEASGIAPTTNPAGTAIGRGFTTTVLQMAQVALSISCRGDTPGISVIGKLAGDPVQPDIELRHFETVIDGMVSAVRDRAGTASKPEYQLREFDLAVKTGTAQISNSPTGNNHAWIIGFAPVVDPLIAFAISAQDVPGHGGDTCAPVLAKILQWLVEERGMELQR